MLPNGKSLTRIAQLDLNKAENSHVLKQLVYKSCSNSCANHETVQIMKQFVYSSIKLFLLFSLSSSFLSDSDWIFN